MARTSVLHVQQRAEQLHRERPHLRLGQPPPRGPPRGPQAAAPKVPALAPSCRWLAEGGGARALVSQFTIHTFNVNSEL
jgi:hypothetical protein